jgi:hypothetical protein
MNLTNYREVSKGGSDVGAGFQFEFSCGVCSRAWKSPFKPYRLGQFAGLVYKFAYFLGDRGSMSRASSTVANVGSNRARESALQEALELAQPRYTECKGCQRVACEECFDQRSQLCESCTKKAVRTQRDSIESNRTVDPDSGAGAGASAGMKCPNCNTGMGNGRFCAECGFDAASTHKSCPGCGVMCTRAARFCPECGHGF